MSEDAPGPTRLIEALGVARNAKIGFAAGIGLAILMYTYRVAELGGPISPAVNGTENVTATPESPALFLMLAFVLATSAGVLVTGLLTLAAAVRLAREVE